MARNLGRPFFPTAPTEYSKSYMDSLIQSFAVYVDQQQNPGEGRNTTIVLTDLTGSDYSLELGTIYQIDGILRISQVNAPTPEGVSATGGVGSVSIAIS
jgi:hypothetical protein